MIKPICCSCKRFYRPDKNGVNVLEQAPNCDGALPGTTNEDDWHPYKIWHADRWVCRGCGNKIVVGAGSVPMAINHQTDKMEQLLPLVDETVNDC